MWYILLKLALTVVFMGMSAVFVFAAFHELKRRWSAGEVRTQLLVVNRFEQPIYFWFLMTIYSCTVIFGTFFPIYIPVYIWQW